MRLTILKKGLLLIAVPLLFQLIFIAILVEMLSDSAEAEALVLQSKETIRVAEGSYTQALTAMGATRGYVVSESALMEAQALEAINTVPGMIDRLEALVANDPEQLARLAPIDREVTALKRWVTDVTELVRSGRKEQAAERIISLEGMALLNSMRGRLDNFLKAAAGMESQRLAHLREAREAQQVVLAGGLIGATLVTCFVAYLFSRGVSKRLATVTRNAEGLAENHPLPPQLGGSDEIARLDAVLHETARRLTAAAEKERVYKEEIELRAAALAAVNESLRQQTQENEMFVYSVSHDLRSPLVNLQGFSQELAHAGADLRRLLDDDRVPADVRGRVIDVLEADVADSVRFIQSAVTRSAAIIDALLRLSRAGRVEYRLQEVDVAGVVRRIVDAMSNTIEEKKAAIEIGELPTCWGDPTAVEQVLGNLIGNAVNYLDPARPGRIQIGTTSDPGSSRDGMRTYYVRDNGLGIPAAFLGKVFVAFQRLHGDVAKGEGIGLALVRRMIERHGGEVWVESTQGVGTTFYVALPARQPKTEVAVDPQQLSEVPA